MFWVTSPYQEEWLKEDGVLKLPLRMEKGSLISEECEIDETKFQVVRIAELKNKDGGKEMNHQNMSDIINRRGFLKECCLGRRSLCGTAFAGSPLACRRLG